MFWEFQKVDTHNKTGKVIALKETQEGDLKKRNPSKVATVIKGKNKQFVEPLVTIYEPKAYPILLQYLAQGYSCPRKMLINSDVEIIEINDDLIRNINTPEDFENALQVIKKVKWNPQKKSFLNVKKLY